MIDGHFSALVGRPQIIAAVEESKASGKDFPICVGTSHPGTAATAALSQMAQDLGAAAVMITPSKEPGQNEGMLLAYYAKVADKCPGLPIVLQDHPASTQVFDPAGRAAAAAVRIRVPDVPLLELLRGACWAPDCAPP